MGAFLIVDGKITNREKYEEYKALAKPIVEKFGGVYRVRGGAIDLRERDLWAPTRVVIIEFPNVERARAFLDSDEYGRVRPMRTENADSTVFIVEGD